VSLNVLAVLDPLVSHALASGMFERVNTVEPKSPPGHGLHSAIWVQEIGPYKGKAGSGLASTTGRLVFMNRLYSNMVQDPADMIDPNLLDATSILMGLYSGDFTLGGAVREVDLLGSGGLPLSARAGYITVNQTMYRCMDIFLPLVINDIWEQAA
jgi:hypothetical protein